MIKRGESLGIFWVTKDEYDEISTEFIFKEDKNREGLIPKSLEKYLFDHLKHKAYRINL
jgi:hypothetical protein